MDNRDGTLDRKIGPGGGELNKKRKIRAGDPLGSYSSIAKNHTHIPTKKPHLTSLFVIATCSFSLDLHLSHLIELVLNPVVPSFICCCFSPLSQFVHQNAEQTFVTMFIGSFIQDPQSMSSIRHHIVHDPLLNYILVSRPYIPPVGPRHFLLGRYFLHAIPSTFAYRSPSESRTSNHSSPSHSAHNPKMCMTMHKD
jgi:hypothetical protein